MSAKKVLVVLLLAAIFCFVSVAGYGEIIQPEKPSISWYIDELSEESQKGIDLWREDCDLTVPSMLDVQLLWAMLSYVMRNPTTFEHVNIIYDRTGRGEKFYPKGVNTKEKVSIEIRDVRGYFSGRSDITLKETFKMSLDSIYSFIEFIATDMNTDVVALFFSKGSIPLGYFYQGEYYLWDE